MFCSNCGKEVPDGSAFCPHCGKSYAQVDTSTKIGLHAGFVAAILFLSGLIGFQALLLTAGYILIVEENKWLKANAVKAIAIFVAFFLGFQAVGFLDDIFGFFNVFLGWFKAVTYLHYPANLDTLIRAVLTIAEKVVFIMLAAMSLKMKTVNMGFADKLVEDK